MGELGIQVIAIDGKTAEGSYDRATASKALHLVSAWATEHRLVLAQAKVQDKSNKITLSAVEAEPNCCSVAQLECTRSTL